MSMTRYGRPMQTFSGGKFYPQDPRVEDMFLVDVEHVLSKVCRFGGHCDGLYTVLQHLVNCVEKADQDEMIRHDLKLMRTILLHDSSETWIQDLTSPTKYALPDYQVMEKRIEEVAAKRFDLYFPFPEIVKTIDLRMRVTEAAVLMTSAKDRWWEAPEFPPPYPDIKIVTCDNTFDPWRTFLVRQRFLSWCKQLNIR